MAELHEIGFLMLLRRYLLDSIAQLALSLHGLNPFKQQVEEFFFLIFKNFYAFKFFSRSCPYFHRAYLLLLFFGVCLRVGPA